MREDLREPVLKTLVEQSVGFVNDLRQDQLEEVGKCRDVQGIEGAEG